MPRRVQKAGLDLAEAGLAGEQRERLRDERLRVRQVGEVVPERERREWVDRLRDEQPAEPERPDRVDPRIADILFAPLDYAIVARR